MKLHPNYKVYTHRTTLHKLTFDSQYVLDHFADFAVLREI